METWYTLDENSTLDFLCKAFVEVTSIFLRYSIDFSERGTETLAEVCRRDGLDLRRVMIEMETEIEGGPTSGSSWDPLQPGLLIDHLIQSHHQMQRLDLSAVVGVAQRIERRHQGEAGCPSGLADLLARTRDGAIEHMDQKEHVVYPALRAAELGPEARPLVEAMYRARAADEAAFEHIRTATHSFSAPSHASLDWRTLYRTLKNMEVDLFNQFNLERRFLYPRALKG